MPQWSKPFVLPSLVGGLEAFSFSATHLRFQSCILAHVTMREKSNGLNTPGILTECLIRASVDS